MCSPNRPAEKERKIRCLQLKGEQPASEHPLPLSSSINLLANVEQKDDSGGTAGNLRNVQPKAAKKL